MPAQTADGGDVLHEAYGREILDLFDDLQPGDKVLWGDREVPCTVARIVDAEDRVGQALTARVIGERSRSFIEQNDTNLRVGDVFITPAKVHNRGLTGLEFVLIHGPRGGFYAIANARRDGRRYPALFRAVRSYHKTKFGRPGQGAFAYEQWFDDTLYVVGRGEPPAVLDEAGDLPAYEDIGENRVVVYDTDTEDHYGFGTYDEVFDEGLFDWWDGVQAELARDPADGDDEDGPWAAIPPATDVTRETMKADGTTYGTVTVTSIFQSEYGLKATLDTPAPWDVADEATPVNDVLKDTPWEETHRQWDPGREAWTVDADELTGIAYELAHAGYAVVDEAEREG